MADKQQKLKVLLVEDNGMFFNIVSEMLTEHDVVGEKTAAAGVEKYKEFRPDITFLDISLPDGNGHDILVKIKEIDPEAYVIMMTASRLKEDILQSMDEGAQGYIVKPFSSDMMAESIKEYREYKAGKAS